MVFGLSMPLATMQLLRLFEGRRLYFSGSNAYALAALYNLMLPGQPTAVKAPAGMDKAQVFVRNVRAQEQVMERADELVNAGEVDAAIAAEEAAEDRETRGVGGGASPAA